MNNLGTNSCRDFKIYAIRQMFSLQGNWYHPAVTLPFIACNMTCHTLKTTSISTSIKQNPAYMYIVFVS